MRKSVYDKRTEETRDALDGNRNCYKANKVYEGKNGYAYYINTHGFYHIYMPGKVRWSDGSIMSYTLDDYRLNPDNTMTLTRQADFETKEERLEYVKQLIA